MNNKIVIKNREPQQITINGGGEVIGITTVLVNGIDVTEGSVAYVIVPTKTSELINDSGFITQETDPTIPYYIKQITQGDINTWNNKQEQLVSGINIKTVNDNSLLGSGNIDISTSYTAGYGININASNEISNTITSYNDLTDLPTIPTSTSQLINNSGFVTSSELSDVAFSGSYADLSNIPEIPDSTSELINDSGFIDMNLLWNLFPKSTGSGTSINLSDTVKNTPLYLTLGATELSQDGTPTPSSPQDIHTISGSNTIKVEGKNLLNNILTTQTLNGITATRNNDGSITLNGTATAQTDFTFLNTKLEFDNGTYTFSISDVGNSNVRLQYGVSGYGIMDTGTATKSYTTTFPNTSMGTSYSYINMFRVRVTNGAVLNNYTIYPMIEKGSTATTYEPYVSQEADIDLGDLEYCKIGNYEDRIFKNISGDTDYSSEREDGAWYIKKNIGKVVLDGTENWQYYNGIQYITSITDYKLSGLMCMSNYYPSQENIIITSNLQDKHIAFRNEANNPNLYIKDTDYSDSATFKTWLSSNNVSVYYILATPTYTKITGTLAEQLETIYKELTPESEQTNISQINEDLPFTISATTLKSLSSL